jgi:hypothetical protein
MSMMVDLDEVWYCNADVRFTFVAEAWLSQVRPQTYTRMIIAPETRTCTA